MATIYRFVIESRDGGGGKSTSGRKTSGATKGASKKGKWVSLLNSKKGGVEHNRKMRAINPLINKATGGVWERGMRAGRATLGLVQRNTETGAIRLSGTSIAILTALVINILLKWQNSERAKADKINAQNFRQLENGTTAIRGAYNVTTNFWTGQRTYNQNK